MGHKINPNGFRVGITKDWTSRWYLPKKSVAPALLEDQEIRKFLTKRLETAGVKVIEIERSLNEINVTAKVSKPGIVIGRGGAGVDELREELRKLTDSKISLTVEEVRNAETDAQLIADFICRQLKRRLPYRRVMASAVNAAMERGVKGIKIRLSGLLGGGNTIARTETLSQGSVPSQTLRADLDFAQVDCLMLFGKIGIKVWVYKG
ncbi:30S ribosomal protein S3, partial [Patescibacteria group bacterium]|nr:30S ribosomal protein S3 [Patescibacteria group bacterium]